MGVVFTAGLLTTLMKTIANFLYYSIKNVHGTIHNYLGGLTYLDIFIYVPAEGLTIFGYFSSSELA